MKRKTPLEIQDRKNLLESIDEAELLGTWRCRLAATIVSQPNSLRVSEQDAPTSDLGEEQRTERNPYPSLYRLPLKISFAEVLDHAASGQWEALRRAYFARSPRGNTVAPPEQHAEQVSHD